MASPAISAADLESARTRLGLTPDELAAELGLSSEEYAACMAGRAPLSKLQARFLAFRLACVERDEALARSGLPTCAWIEQWEREEPSEQARPETQMAHFRRGKSHATSCATCQARERFVRERFPDMPALPLPGGMRVFTAVVSWVDARPEWIRPAFYGAGVLALMAAFRAVFLLLGAIREPRLLLTAFGAIAAASLAGAGGGLVYSLIGRPARRLPVVGPYLAGIVAVAGYLACVLALLALVGGDDAPSLDGAGSLSGFAFVSIAFGLVVGYQWFRPEKQDV